MNFTSLRPWAALVALLGSMAPAVAGSLVFSLPGSHLNGMRADPSGGGPWIEYYGLGDTGGTVSSIVWWGYHGPGSKGAAYDNFSVWLDKVLQSGPLTETPEAAGYTRYELDIADMEMPAWHKGTLEILNNSMDVRWFWQDDNNDYALYAYSLESNPSAVAIPEPGSLALAGLALLGLASAARRRREP